MLTEEVTARWTKYNGTWAVQVPHDADDLAPGTTINVENRAGIVKSVTVAGFAGATKWGQVYTLAAKKQAADEATVEEGYYLYEEDVYKVRTSKAGRNYATILTAYDTADGKKKGRWEYARGVIRDLTDDHAITVEQAAEFGHLHGFCAICGATLTKPESVERGIGPVCVKNIGGVA